MVAAQTSSAPAVAPAATATAAAIATPAKAYAFEVVSIRQNISARSAGEQQQFAPTPDGYRMINLPIAIVIMTAYFPQVGGAAFYSQDQVKGYPDWMDTERC